MNEITIEINGKKVIALKGENLLEVLKRNNIEVPTLCHLKGLFPSGACRMCVVEVEGRRNLVASCSEPVMEGMKIHSHSPRVINARKTIVELLLSNHPDDCLYCERNGNCELQNLAELMHVRERKIAGKKNKYRIDVSSPSLVRDPSKCILCGRCVRVCEEIEGVSAIDFTYRGSKTIIAPAFHKGLNLSSCVNCGQCILVCPTGALKEKSYLDEVRNALNQKDLFTVVQYAPSITVSLAEEFGLEPGTDMNGVLNAALRKIGFKAVFDTSFSADLTIMEESAELIDRITNGGVLPMITSCCPAWVKYAEQFYPDLLPNISTCKSPQQMMGAIIKHYYAMVENLDPQKIYSVSIMPCTAKKFEHTREEQQRQGLPDVDVAITTRELIKLIKMHGINLKELEPELADSPLGSRSTAGKIFGASGGVMEAAIRTAYYRLTGKELVSFKIPAVRGLQGRKETRIEIGSLNLGVAVVNGLQNARLLLEEIRKGRNDIQFIEVMACPGGCINGGGQPIGMKEENIKARMNALYKIDESETIKASHQNPYIIELYNKFLKKPLSHKSHELLHTRYQPRNVIK